MNQNHEEPVDTKKTGFFEVLIIYKKEIQKNFRCKKYVHNMLIVYAWKLIHWEDQDMLALYWQSKDQQKVTYVTEAIFIGLKVAFHRVSVLEMTSS